MSGKGNHGDAVGSLATNSVVPGKLGQGLSFNGTSDYVDIGTSFDIATLPFSISAWVNINNITTYHTIVSKRDSFDPADCRFMFEVSTSATCPSNGNVLLARGASALCSSYIMTAGKWTHLVIVVISGHSYLYVDGTYQEDIGSFTLGTDATSKMLIGAAATGASKEDYLGGKMDDVRIYNRTLSASEISSLYNSGR